MISIADLSREKIEELLRFAHAFKQQTTDTLLNNKILASCFYEPSTRTRLSFESAMLRLGGRVIGFSDIQATSSQKGESLRDSIKIISHYADVIVIRHPLEGSARCASEVSSVPVINAGDGANQHPTQTLVDLFAILESQGRLDQLHIAMCGDLKYGRTIHSLALACALFNMRFYFISPEQLSVPPSILHELRKKGIKFSFHRSIEEVLPKIDILYMTRIQKERIEDGEYEKMKQQFQLKEEMLTLARKNFKIFHPLPRVNEIETAVDATPFAYYFKQAEGGIAMRQAVLAHSLGVL